MIDRMWMSAMTLCVCVSDAAIWWKNRVWRNWVSQRRLRAICGRVWKTPTLAIKGRTRRERGEVASLQGWSVCSWWRRERGDSITTLLSESKWRRRYNLKLLLLLFSHCYICIVLKEGLASIYVSIFSCYKILCLNYSSRRTHNVIGNLQTICVYTFSPISLDRARRMLYRNSH